MAINNSASLNMISDPIGRLLWRMSYPMMWGLLAVMSIAIVDAYFIGFLGVEELAAYAFASPLIFIVMSVSFGMGVGVSSKISRLIGSGKNKQAVDVSTDSLYLMAIMMIAISLPGYFYAKNIFSLMGASESVLIAADEYMKIWFAGITFLAVAIIGNNISRSAGDSVSPGRQMIVVTILNIVLDPLFIFGFGPIPAMGMSGAAFATFLAFILAFVLSIHALAAKKLINFALPKLETFKQSSVDILKVGLPATFAYLSTPVGAAILIAIASPLGKDAVAALGVGTRIEPLASLGMIALSIIVTPFVGQNIGAGSQDRVREGVYWAMKFCVVWGVGAALILLVFAPSISVAFSDSAEVQSDLLDYLHIVPLSYAFYGFNAIAISLSNATNRPGTAVLITVIREFVLLVPLAWLGASMFGSQGIYYAMAGANIAAGIAVLLWIHFYILPVECGPQSRKRVDN